MRLRLFNWLLQPGQLYRSRLVGAGLLALGVGPFVLFVMFVALNAATGVQGGLGVGLALCLMLGLPATLAGLVVAAPFVALLQISGRLSAASLAAIASVVSIAGMLLFRESVAADEVGPIGAWLALSVAWSVPGIAVAFTIWQFASEQLESWETN